MPASIGSLLPSLGEQGQLYPGTGQVEREPRQWAASRHLGVLCKTEVLLMEGSLAKGLG